MKKNIAEKSRWIASLILCAALCVSGCQAQPSADGTETESGTRANQDKPSGGVSQETGEETSSTVETSSEEFSSTEESPSAAETAPQESGSDVPEFDLEESWADGGWTREKLQETYPDKTVLVWAHDRGEDIPGKRIEALNEYLAQKGYSFVICFESLIRDQSQAPMEMLTYSVGPAYIAKVNALIEAGMAPDILDTGSATLGDGTLPGTQRALENDWFLPLDDYLETEEGSVLRNAFPENYWKSLQFDGHYYGLTSRIQYTGETYYVNRELMERYAITEEMLAGCRIEDLGEILQKVKEGEGKKCTPLVLSGTSSDMSDFIGISEKHSIKSDALVFEKEDETGTLQNLFATEKAADWFRVVADYRKQGYLDGGDQWFICVNISHAFMNLSRTVKVVNMSHFAVEEGAEDMTEQEYEDAALENIAEVVYRSGPLYPQSASLAGVCSQSAHQEEALQALTLVMSDPEVIDLLFFGTEGEDYERIDGYVSNSSYETNIAWKYSNQFLASPLVCLKGTPEEDRFALVNSLYLSPQAQAGGIILDLQEYEEEIKKIQGILEGNYMGLYTGEFEDVDGTLKELNAKLQEAGIDAILEEANRQLEAGGLHGGGA